MRISTITEVWAHNLEAEVSRISSMLIDHGRNHVALDTEFPGVVMRLVSNDGQEANYQTIRQNVDVLKLIQLGLTLSDAPLYTEPFPSTTTSTTTTSSTAAAATQHNHETWQFNFKFSLASDMYAQDSIDLLRESGVDFAAHEADGIDPVVFADLITTSGLLCNDAIQWITFHGGYDFAYLMKALVGSKLPRLQAEFFRLLAVLFPRRHDLKCLIRKRSTTVSTPTLAAEASFISSAPSLTTSATTAAAAAAMSDATPGSNNHSTDTDSGNGMEGVKNNSEDVEKNASTADSETHGANGTLQASNGSIGTSTPGKPPRHPQDESNANNAPSLSPSPQKQNASTPLQKLQPHQQQTRSLPLLGGLNRIAKIMGCERIGNTHQAGSDSLLTLNVYFRVLDNVLHGEIDATDDGKLYGLGGGKMIH